VVEIPVPPLRERREDVPILANHFVAKYARELGRPVRGIGRDALRLLTGHEWRGNVRELSNAIERAVIFAATDVVTPADLPEAVRAATPRDLEWPGDLREATAEFERAHILRVIAQCDGNKRQAAKVLGLGVTSLYRKLNATGGTSEPTPPEPIGDIDSSGP
jgi:DNA-binding NtrC family response regulator